MRYFNDFNRIVYLFIFFFNLEGIIFVVEEACVFMVSTKALQSTLSLFLSLFLSLSDDPFFFQEIKGSASFHKFYS